jgi:hypothetical protein
MKTTIDAKFDGPSALIKAATIQLNGSFANMDPSKLSVSDIENESQARFRLGPNESEMRKDETKSPAEKHYLNGGQYLTGGVGHRLAFV